uniref:Uncharacterized protein n=1 Tax=Parascaris equorum TaxID=6256 RepID=A0A914S6J9_PAREQ
MRRRILCVILAQRLHTFIHWASLIVTLNPKICSIRISCVVIAMINHVTCGRLVSL